MPVWCKNSSVHNLCGCMELRWELGVKLGDNSTGSDGSGVLDLTRTRPPYSQRQLGAYHRRDHGSNSLLETNTSGSHRSPQDQDLGQSEPVDLQQNLQQTCAFGLLLGFGCASASILSPYFTSIKHLFTNTYKPLARTVDPKVVGSSPIGLAP